MGSPILAKAEANGFSVVGVGSFPISDQISIFGKLGLFRWDLDLSVTDGISTLSVGESGTDITYGVGARYNLTERVGVRVEWEQFSDVGDAGTTGESDLTLLSAGVELSF